MFTFAAMLMTAGIATSGAAAADDAEKCLLTKIKIVSKYEACRFKAEATAISKSMTVDNSKCEAKFTASWAAAELKYGLDCPTNGDAATRRDDSSGHVSAVVLALENAPVCGDNVKQRDETCDGTDFGGATCVSQGFGSGTLACAPDCGSFDTSGCSTDECSPLDQTGCDAGEGCYPVSMNEICAAAGTATQYQGCTLFNDCAPGLACADPYGYNFCVRLCSRVGGGGLPCPAGHTCVSNPDWDPSVGWCEAG